MAEQSGRGSVRGEPFFEAPPRLLSKGERRLSLRAAASFAGGDGLHEFRDNAVSLRDGAATAVGRAVVAAFALVPGPLAGGPDSLAGVLGDALVQLGDHDAVMPFEGAVTTPYTDCVLLRGVLLPTVGGADAVLSWKQVLDDDATARLRAELLREMARGRRPGPRADAFG